MYLLDTIYVASSAFDIIGVVGVGRCFCTRSSVDVLREARSYIRE